VPGESDVELLTDAEDPADLRRLLIPHLATWDEEAKPPAAKRMVADEARLLSGNRETLKSLADALVEALLEASSQITPQKKVGDGCSSRSIIIGGRSNKTGKSYVQYEIFGGGSGGRSGKDGVSGTNVNQSNARIAPIEIIESEFATRLRRFELIPDSGGAGQFRGGLGFVREYEVLDNDARFSLRSTKHTVAPKGLEGGADGKTGCAVMIKGTARGRCATQVTTSWYVRKSDAKLGDELLPGKRLRHRDSLNPVPIDGRPRFVKRSLDDGEKVKIAAIDPDFA
jgi:N-methylhydantoinase B/oxoprolinase/acetone carboxylase alpha subunit